MKSQAVEKLAELDLPFSNVVKSLIGHFLLFLFSLRQNQSMNPDNPYASPQTVDSRLRSAADRVRGLWPPAIPGLGHLAVVGLGRF